MDTLDRRTLFETEFTGGCFDPSGLTTGSSRELPTAPRNGPSVQEAGTVHRPGPARV